MNIEEFEEIYTCFFPEDKIFFRSPRMYPKLLIAYHEDGRQLWLTDNLEDRLISDRYLVALPKWHLLPIVCEEWQEIKGGIYL